MIARNPISSAVVFSLLLLSAAGCPRSRPECSQDSHCGDGRICRAGSCGCAAGHYLEGGQCKVGCQKGADCGEGHWACAPGRLCVPICTKQADCTAPAICEDLICRPPACGDDGECSGGQACIGGSCQTPPASVAHCQVVPAHAVLVAGSSATFTVASQDVGGTPLPYGSEVSWSATGLDAQTTGASVSAVFTASASLVDGTGAITASIHGTPCAAAEVTAYATAPAAKLRVVVVSALDQKAVRGATVVLGTTISTTDEAGVALLDASPGEKHTISIFATDYAWATVIDTVAADLLIPLKPTPHPVAFHGQLKDTDFAGLFNPSGTLHLSIAGASIPGNLADLSLQSLLGPSHSLTVDLGGNSKYGPFDVPGGIVLGLGSNMFGDEGGGHYDIVTASGVRTFWSLGGNAIIGDILKIAGPALNGGSGDIQSQIPTILAAAIPLLGSLESGATSGIAATADGTLNGAGGPSLKLDTLMRLHLNVTTPELLTYVGDDGQPAAFDGLVVIGGTLARSQGFVPLGLTAGVDQSGPGGATTPDHFTDAVGTAGQAQHLPLRVAPRHGGLEQAPWAFVTLGAPLSRLISGGDGLALSGSVHFTPASLRYDGGASAPVDLSNPLLPVPNGASVDEASRTLTVPSVSGATYHQLDIGDENALWTVYFPAGTTSVTIPTPPEGWGDRFMGATPPSILLKSIRLGYGSTTWDDVWQFDAINANDLTLQTDAFSVRAVKRDAGATR